VIAEGVETNAQAAFLRNQRCEEAQGYLYAQPLSATEFEAYLRANQVVVDADAAELRHSRANRHTAAILGRGRFPGA
jgi:predicted signal transduction protein with EAL and GGDEF domain